MMRTTAVFFFNSHESVDCTFAFGIGTYFAIGPFLLCTYSIAYYFQECN